MAPSSSSNPVSNNNSTNKNNKKRRIGSVSADTGGMDAWLQTAGKSLPVGGQIRLKLVKGPHQERTGDPVDKRAAPELFPAVAKFPVSVVQPDFSSKRNKKHRLYQQDIPKPVESSDEEQERQKDGKPKRRWRYNANKAPPRQWILQDEVDFLETMMARRRETAAAAKGKPNAAAAAAATAAAASAKQQQESLLSSRYEGTAEHNASHYVLMSLDDNSCHRDTAAAAASVWVRALPTPSVSFCQPAARRALTLSQAEQAIQDQRAGLKTAVAVAAPSASGGNGSANSSGGLRLGRHPAANVNSTKSRLMQKLQKKMAANSDEEEGDDVMGDVAFRHSKGGGGAARRELLGSMGDGLAVSSDGVLGGGNDAAFGGRGRRFGAFQATGEQKSAGADANTERGADGAAMADDFYMRDVRAEYEELDYDANEQFDDDDVDVGETEMAADAEGFGGDEDEEEDEDEEDNGEEEEVGGVVGLATVAGFRMLLAKARGEAVPDAAEVAATAAAQSKRSVSPKPSEKKKDEAAAAAPDHVSKIMLAAAEQPKRDGRPPAAAAAATPTAPAAPPEIQTDENGLRIITLEAVRREIWLNQGSIPSSRLIKIFSAKKKFGANRPTKFKEIVKELCTMKQDPVHGAMLVLKQHYAHMD